MGETIKTSFVLPRSLYIRLKTRAIEEGRTVREVLIDAILNYLSYKSSSRQDLMDLILKPASGAGPEDFKEYSYGDVGD